MSSKASYVRRLAIVFVACIGLLLGAASASASAMSSTTSTATGTIEVCKKLQGSNGDGFTFHFVVKDNKDKVVKDFWLKKNECKKVPNLEEGKYTVWEYQHAKCVLVKIQVDDKQYTNPDSKIGVDVKKDKTVKVTFFNKCKKDDCS